tara:strand:- start:174 stop:575 length:402 start_codon:yes stop_codon:yes gene_type:complete
MRTLDLNLEENRGELDFNFDNMMGTSLTSNYSPSSTNIKYTGSLYNTDSPLFGSTPKTDRAKYSINSNEETKSIMDRIRDFKLTKFNPTKTSIAPPAPQTAGMGTSTTKKSNLPIILGGVAVVGVAMFFIFRK